MSPDNLDRAHVAVGRSDLLAQRVVRAARWLTDRSFGDRYGHRAVVLETIAAVPAMAAANLLHLKHLRRMTDDDGWIRTLMNEAENQRAHLMMFVALSRPSSGERFLILISQGLFYNVFSLLYLCCPRFGHRLAGYIAEDALRAYEDYLEALAIGRLENPAAPAAAREYWHLEEDARLADALRAIRQDEAIHRDIDHFLADSIDASQLRRSV